MPRGLPVGGGGGLDLTHTFKTHFFPGNLKKKTGDEEVSENAGWADAMARILHKDLPPDKVHL